MHVLSLYICVIKYSKIKLMKFNRLLKIARVGSGLNLLSFDFLKVNKRDKDVIDKGIWMSGYPDNWKIN